MLAESYQQDESRLAKSVRMSVTASDVMVRCARLSSVLRRPNSEKGCSQFKGLARRLGGYRYRYRLYLYLLADPLRDVEFVDVPVSPPSWTSHGGQVEDDRCRSGFATFATLALLP